MTKKLLYNRWWTTPYFNRCIKELFITFIFVTISIYITIITTQFVRFLPLLLKAKLSCGEGLKLILYFIAIINSLSIPLSTLITISLFLFRNRRVISFLYYSGIRPLKPFMPVILFVGIVSLLFTYLSTVIEYKGYKNLYKLYLSLYKRGIISKGEVREKGGIVRLRENYLFWYIDKDLVGNGVAELLDIKGDSVTLGRGKTVLVSNNKKLFIFFDILNLPIVYFLDSKLEIIPQEYYLSLNELRKKGDNFSNYLLYKRLFSGLFLFMISLFITGLINYNREDTVTFCVIVVVALFLYLFTFLASELLVIRYHFYYLYGILLHILWALLFYFFYIIIERLQSVSTRKY